MEFVKNQYDISPMMSRFPNFELSYETISHKKVSPLYDLCLAIPVGKKVFIWFSFLHDTDVCVLFYLNKEKKIINHELLNINFDPSLALDTILYCTLIEDKTNKTRHFIIEDIIFYQGIYLKKMKIIEKLLLIENVMEQTNDSQLFYIPNMWSINISENDDEQNHNYQSKMSKIMYPVHHIQYRSTKTMMPFLNSFQHITTGFNVFKPENTKLILTPSLNSNITTTNTHTTTTPMTLPIPINNPSFKMDFTKPQYKYKTVFQVSADLQFDIYHLYAYGQHKKPIYYNVAYIPNYKSSVFLNGLFRNIRENKNLDYIEESDDEDDFQNIEMDKYVDTKKILLMECIFNSKFKKWVPVRVVDNRSKVVHINNLVVF
jgi:hypothetical protein